MRESSERETGNAKRAARSPTAQHITASSKEQLAITIVKAIKLECIIAGKLMVSSLLS